MGRRVRMNKKRRKAEKRLWRRLEREGKQAEKQDARNGTTRAAP
jgi:hypothetical protein